MLTHSFEVYKIGFNEIGYLGRCNQNVHSAPESRWSAQIFQDREAIFCQHLWASSGFSDDGAINSCGYNNYVYQTTEHISPLYAFTGIININCSEYHTVSIAAACDENSATEPGSISEVISVGSNDSYLLLKVSQIGVKQKSQQNQSEPCYLDFVNIFLGTMNYILKYL